MSKTPELDSKSDEQLNGNQSLNNMNNNNNNNTNEVSNITNGIEESAKSATNSGQTDSNNSVKRKFRTLTFGRRKKSLTCSSNKCKNNCNDCNNTKMSDTFSNRKDNCNNGKKKKSSSGWAFKFCARTDSCTDVTEAEDTCRTCICTAYKKTDEQPNESDSSIITVNNGYVDNCNTNNDNTDNRNSNQLEMESNNSITPIVFSSQEANELITNSESLNEPYVNSNLVSGDVNAVNSGATHHSSSIATQNMMSEVRSVQVRVSELALALRNQLALTVSPYPYLARWGEVTELTPGFLNRFCLRGDSSMTALSDGQQIHTQIDYIHCLVPDLLQISNCSFYWGKMDRYEAERLLDNKPEGTFLLRDSAQEEHLFSVSFRRFDRSLHARIEQWNHRFSFDSHDPGVYASTTVCGLIEHYKDPSHCMFFEPMLTIPLHRNFTFSLQHLSRATISSLVSYDTIQSIQLPKRLKNYLKEYHYKQQVRVRRLDSDH